MRKFFYAALAALALAACAPEPQTNDAEIVRQNTTQCDRVERIAGDTIACIQRETRVVNGQSQSSDNTFLILCASGVICNRGNTIIHTAPPIGYYAHYSYSRSTPRPVINHYNITANSGSGRSYRSAPAFRTRSTITYRPAAPSRSSSSWSSSRPSGSYSSPSRSSTFSGSRPSTSRSSSSFGSSSRRSSFSGSSRSSSPSRSSSSFRSSSRSSSFGGRRR